MSENTTVTVDMSRAHNFTQYLLSLPRNVANAVLASVSANHNAGRVAEREQNAAKRGAKAQARLVKAGVLPAVPAPVLPAEQPPVLTNDAPPVLSDAPPVLPVSDAPRAPGKR